MEYKRKDEIESFFPQDEYENKDFDWNNFKANQDNVKNEMLQKIKIKKKKRRVILYEYTMIIGLSYLVLCSTLLMPFLRVQSIQIEGSKIYHEESIIKALNLPEKIPYHLLSMSALETRIQSLPLIQSVNVWKGRGRTLQVSVVEQLVLGYYIEDQAMFLLPNGSNVEILEEQLDYISDLPYLHGLSEVNRERFAKEVSGVSHEVLRTISEIMPYPTSYDPNMLQLITNEGLMIRTSMSSLFLLEEYRNILYSLENREHCLYLDGINLAIVSQVCEDELVVE